MKISLHSVRFGIILCSLFLFCFSIQLASAAHFIVGNVFNASDGSSPNGLVVTLWNPVNGISDNTTDIVGISGNSGTDNLFLIDCELLNNPCSIGDQLFIQIFNTGNGYISNGNVSVITTGFGFDVAPNLSIISPPVITSILVDDSLSVPTNEIDLLAGSNVPVTCRGVISTYFNESYLLNVSGVFFDSSSASFSSIDDNNNHYSNYSCFLNASYGTINETLATCSFNVAYYARASTWNCTLSAYNTYTSLRSNSNTTTVNSLLAIETPSSIDFGLVGGGSVANESSINISNYGNVMLNLSLSGYASSVGDNNSMNCTFGSPASIPISFMKYNLTRSNNGTLSLSQFNTLYQNLTTNESIRRFNLMFRQNDSVNDALNTTYWRIYVPSTAGGTCMGNIVLGARRSAGF